MRACRNSLVVFLLATVAFVSSAQEFPSSSAVVPIPPTKQLFAGGRLATYTQSQSEVWFRAHPADSRTPRLRSALGGRPAALWLTGGPRDLPNLADYVADARASSATPVIVLYNIPARDDGVSGRRMELDSRGYRAWVDAVRSALGSTRSIVIVEPDALWLADRQFSSDKAGFAERTNDIRYAASRFQDSPGNAVYVDAGTSSGSVTPQRMAQLLALVGVSADIGFAVNVSSFAPQGEIGEYADAVRQSLWRQSGVSTRYVIDTSRNGADTWDHTWCNPPGRKIGAQPGTVTANMPGLDVNLWVKAPGTSDGDCGVGRGTRGGDFMPDVALGML